MLKRNSRLLLALSVATPLLFAACDSNNDIFGPGNIAGTYELTVYAGSSVPITFTIQPGDPDYPNGASFRVVGGDLVLNSNGTFVETNNYFITPTGESGFNDSFSSSGSWTSNGTSITFNAPPQNGNSSRFVTATFSDDPDGDRINYQEDNGNGLQSYEYRR
jgi:hypothetical protein